MWLFIHYMRTSYIPWLWFWWRWWRWWRRLAQFFGHYIRPRRLPSHDFFKRYENVRALIFRCRRHPIFRPFFFRPRKPFFIINIILLFFCCRFTGEKPHTYNNKSPGKQYFLVFCRQIILYRSHHVNYTGCFIMYIYEYSLYCLENVLCVIRGLHEFFI